MGDWRDNARQRLKDKQSKGRFKLDVGENTLRILPNARGAERSPFFEYYIHREVGPNKRFLRCGKKVPDAVGDCWLCDRLIPKLEASGNKAKLARAAALERKEQFVVQVAVLDTDSNKYKGPYLWAVSTGGAKSLAAGLLRLFQSKKRDYADPKKGYNLTIDRTGTGMTDTRYGPPTPDEEPSKVPSDILGKLKKFSDLVPGYSEEEQKAAYFGRDREDDADTKRKGRDEEEEEEELEEDEESESETEEEEEGDDVKKKKNKKKKKPSADEEEEEDEHVGEEEEEETESEEEEEEEAPKKKKKKKPAEEEEEEEEPEPEEEEEEEEEKPKKKKKKR